MTSQYKAEEIQAWVRFALGVIALAGVVWGASGNMTTIMNMALSNQRASSGLILEDKSINGSIRDIELNSKEFSTKQIMMMDSLNRIENRLGTK